MSMDKNKACILSFYPGGGIGVMTKCFLNLLKELNYEVDVYYFAKVWECAREKSVEYEGVKYNRLPYFPTPFISQLNYLLPSLFMERFLKKYDLLFSISGSFHVSLPFVIQRKKHITKIATVYYEEHISKINLKKPKFKYVILTIELLLFRWLNEFIEKILYKSRYNKAILIDSRYTKRHLEKRYGLRNNTFIFPFCINSNIFKPIIKDGRESPLNLPEQYIFSCGRFDDERKNLILLLNAFKLLKRKRTDYKNLKLIIAGFKPLDVRKYYVKHGLDESVVFLGYISEEEKVKWYQNASVFVLPSKQEGLGIVILEAMACGTPVVSTKCGGPESIIEDGVNGIFTEADKETMAKNIIKVLADRDLAQSLVKNGLQTISKRFSKKAALSVLKKAINEAKK